VRENPLDERRLLDATLDIDTNRPNSRLPRLVAVGHARTASGLTSSAERNHNGVVLVGALAVPTTLTLKNIPDDVYERLRMSADKNRRSLNSEAIVCLETALLPGRMTPEERLARARALRAGLPKRAFKARDIAHFKRKGRS
jgi:plasmid stability protein